MPRGYQPLINVEENLYVCEDEGNDDEKYWPWDDMEVLSDYDIYQMMKRKPRQHRDDPFLQVSFHGRETDKVPIGEDRAVVIILYIALFLLAAGFNYITWKFK